MNGDSQDDLAKIIKNFEKFIHIFDSDMPQLIHKLENCNKFKQTDVNSQSQHTHSDMHAHIFMLLTMSFWLKRQWMHPMVYFFLGDVYFQDFGDHGFLQFSIICSS